MPYRDFDIEYPPGALPTFAVPVYLKLIFGHYNTWYFWFRIELLAFALLMLAAMTWALAELGASKRHAYLALCVAGASPALLGPIALFHYDYFPAMFAAAAVAALVARRGVLACTFATLGAVAKVYPIVIVPIALIELWRHGRWRSLGAGVGATLAVGLVTVGPFVAIAPHGIWWSIHREASRKLETESLGASVLAAAHEIAGVHLHVIARDASHSLTGAWPDAFASASAFLTLVALIGVYLLFLRSSRSREDDRRRVRRGGHRVRSLLEGLLAAVRPVARPDRAARGRAPRHPRIRPARRHPRRDADLRAVPLLPVLALRHAVADVDGDRPQPPRRRAPRRPRLAHVPRDG